MMLTERRRKEIASLAHKKYRAQLGETLVEGIRAVSGAVAAGASLREIIVTHEAAADPDVAVLTGDARIPVHEIDVRAMAKLSDVEHSQGVLAVVEIPRHGDEIAPGAERVLVLDGVQDPGNVGTLVRTAVWFGLDAVVCAPGTADPYAPKVVRATMSALWEIRIVMSHDLAQTLGALKNQGFMLYGATMSGTASDTWRPGGPAALLLGSEAHGLSPAAVELLDEAVAVSTSARPRATDSLNVATAGAVLMYQWTR